MFVEPDTAVHAIITLTQASAPTLEPSVDDISCPTKPVLAARAGVAGAHLIFPQEDVVATGLATVSWEASASREPKPHGRCPSQRGVGSHPVGILQQHTLVAAELFAKLAIVVIPRQLLGATPSVLLPSRARVLGARGTIRVSCRLFNEAETPGGAAASRRIVAPHGAARACAVLVLLRQQTAATRRLLRHLSEPCSQLALVISFAGRGGKIWIQQSGLD
mmetsp:Transcript_72212/g.195274  ORF Transcript_72212/g.195274 Transcript_72212/m.195274 type:complete len:220 (+) Transcript_72212:242-901(+)